MSTSTNYFKNLIGDAVMLDTALTITFPLKMALYTVAPDETGGGTEVTGGSYAQQTVTFVAATGEGVYENQLVEFSGMPAADVVAIAVLDDLNNMLIFDSFTAVSVTADDAYVVSTGSITVSFDPAA